jgi:hypothetical protein
LATPNINVILQGILTATDNTQSPPPYVANIDFQNPTLAGSKFYYDAFFLAASSPGSNVPIGGGGGGADAFLILVINRSSATNLQVNVTVTGAGVAEAAVLGPGGVCLLYDPTEAGPGWSALTLISMSGTCPATVFTAI